MHFKLYLNNFKFTNDNSIINIFLIFLRSPFTTTIVSGDGRFFFLFLSLEYVYDLQAAQTQSLHRALHSDFFFLFRSSKKNYQHLFSQISKKVYVDDELAANKIIKIWESITNNEISKSINLVKLRTIKNFEKLII